MWHVALSISERPHGYTIKSITHLTPHRKPGSPLRKRNIWACKKRLRDVARLYAHLIGTENQSQPWQAAADKARAHPLFLNSHTDTGGSFASESWEIFPSAVFFFSSSLSLCLSPCIPLSPSHLSHFGLWIQTDGRQTSFQTLKKSDSE